MKNKISLIIFFIFLILSNIIFIQAQLEPDPENPDDPLGIGIPSGYIEDPETGFEKIKNKSSSYLLEEWRKMPVFSQIDLFCTKITWVFRILLGEHYSFSGTFLLLIIIWLFFFYNLFKIFNNFGMLSTGTSIGTSLLLTIILGQTKILLKISESIVWLITNQEAWWLRSLIVIGVISLIVLIIYLNKLFGSEFKRKMQNAKEEIKKAKKESEEKIRRADTKALHKAFIETKEGMG